VHGAHHCANATHHCASCPYNSAHFSSRVRAQLMEMLTPIENISGAPQSPHAIWFNISPRRGVSYTYSSLSFLSVQRCLTFHDAGKISWSMESRGCCRCVRMTDGEVRFVSVHENAVCRGTGSSGVTVVADASISVKRREYWEVRVHELKFPPSSPNFLCISLLESDLYDPCPPSYLRHIQCIF